MAGLRQVTGDPVIRRIMLVSAVAFTGAGMIDVAMFSLVTQGLHRPAALLGVLTAIEGAGQRAGRAGDRRDHPPYGRI